ncbi:MAG TPA: Gfo/Idh/MocA family oxidoreductase [Acidobacteriaceae bacterium]
MAAREIGVGVIGFGLGGRVFHAPFVSAVPGLKLVSILQRKGYEAARAYPSARIDRSLDEMLADKSIELIVLSTPNETHLSLATRALEAGKHVVIDKPFTATSADAVTLIDLAKRKGVHAIPFHNRRWDGDFLTVKKLLAENAVGRLVTFESHFDRFRPTPRENTWKEAGDPSHGMLFDLGPHLVDQARVLFGAPATITASVRADRDVTDVEDAFDITLHYSPGDDLQGSARAPNGKGLLVHCRTSYLACINAPRFTLHGTSGSFVKFGLDPQEPALVAGAKVPRLQPGSPESDAWLEEKESEWGKLAVAPNPTDPTTLVEKQVRTLPGDYRSFYANVRDSILGTAPLAVTPQAGYQVARLLELARESSAKGCTLKVEF